MSDFHVTPNDRDMVFDAIAYWEVVIIGAGPVSLAAPPPLTENTGKKIDHEPFHRASANRAIDHRFGVATGRC